MGKKALSVDYFKRLSEDDFDNLFTMKSLNEIYFICILYLYLLFILVIHPMRSDVKRIEGEK